MTLSEAKNHFSKELSGISQTPQLDVEVLLSHFLKMDKTALLLNRSLELTPLQLSEITKAVSTRKTGFPIAYITGHKEFFGYDFLVTPKVLIPKPDTEILVENALKEIPKKIQRETELSKADGTAPFSVPLKICDMCTGSGCIGLSVLRALIDSKQVPENALPRITLADISIDALEVAKRNASHLFTQTEQKQLNFVRTNLFEQLQMQFDFILTNPPYIPRKMVDELLKDGRSEPRLALDGDVTTDGTIKGFPLEPVTEPLSPGSSTPTDDGLEIIRALIPQLQTHLLPGGQFFMETGEYNAKEAARLAERIGFKTKIIKDLEGQLRVVNGK